MKGELIMAKGKKITIMTAEEAAECKRKARGRAVFKEMLTSGQYKASTFENKKRKAERKRRKDEDINIKRGQHF